MYTESYRYTERELEVLRRTSMFDVLRDLGMDTTLSPTRHIHSPFRNENTPSFRINVEKGTWCDYGNCDNLQKSYGDVIDLVMMIKGVSFMEACDYLKDFNPSVSLAHDEIVDLGGRPTHGSSSRPITIGEVHQGVSRSWSLSEYITGERHIPKEIANRYCSIVNYTLTYDNGTVVPRFAIGFPNINGDWALRWPTSSPEQNGKRSSGQDYTAIAPDGHFITADVIAAGRGRHAASVVVFEGFMDFLSWLAWNKVEVPTKCDAVVLNTVNNARSAIDYLASHDRVITYLDNDDRGEKCTAFIQDEIAKLSAPGSETTVQNRSSSFSGFNDVNDAWIVTHRKRQAEELRRSRQASTVEKETRTVHMHH